MQWRCLQETPVFDQKTSSIHTVLFVSFFDANILRRQCSHCVFDRHSLAFETPRHIVYFLLCDHDPVGKSIRYILLEIQFLGIWIIIPPPPQLNTWATQIYMGWVFFLESPFVNQSLRKLICVANQVRRTIRYWCRFFMIFYYSPDFETFCQSRSSQHPAYTSAMYF